jgi:endogenous inhibitor of DNA gyrase (YacG/DUF329 family)
VRTRECPQCREAFQAAETGRPATYCSATCRKEAWLKRRQDRAVAQAVEAERQRANRGNETPLAAENRGNETRPAADGLWPEDEYDGTQ